MYTGALASVPVTATLPPTQTMASVPATAPRPVAHAAPGRYRATVSVLAGAATAGVEVTRTR